MWFCPKCKILIEDNVTNCWKCSMSRVESTSEETKKIHGSSDSDLRGSSTVEAKYPALRIISGMYNFFAWIIAIAAVISIIIVISKNDGEEGQLISLGIFIIGIIIFISLRAVAEVIKVFIDIEENTRKVADKK